MTAQSQISQSDAVQESEPCADLPQDLGRDHRLLSLKVQPVDKGQRVHDGQIGEPGDVHAAHSDGKDLRLQPVSPAFRARVLAHVLFQFPAHRHALGLLVPPLQVVHDPFERLG